MREQKETTDGEGRRIRAFAPPHPFVKLYVSIIYANIELLNYVSTAKLNYSINVLLTC